ncbi:MAG: ribonuclease HII [Candidatus Parvarchaeota archaeon]|nr:ribonuclease HII [Candidatus Jingweiarchaeum tengchongense]MCW1297841.1 ribonuclease HII [Candidatus Jingweiarchaeum tengchongense]MCW1299852.1 ribonuclease HII [Candidatus Jingweiarchaeum tengchongense]MCW1304178.1 ribonuclease HII [Candidatus Jingweiarchaeum tengchongense]MCW1305206.1 ribonuclease HII [Candidatus Jingweiarchaeum tengchongense]
MFNLPKGPLIGSLYICGILVEKDRIKELKNIGVKDSKELKKNEREELESKIKKIAKDFKIVKITPKEIDERASVGMNLNHLEAIKMAEIINTLKPDVAIIDCPSHNTNAFKKFLEKYLEHKCKLKVENYADESYVTVGAASILAKVERDREIEKISKELGIELYNGYPNDEKALELVKNLEKIPGARKYIRSSWYTYKRIEEEKNLRKQKKILDF